MLDRDYLLSLVHGAIGTGSAEDGGVYFLRLTDKQMKLYEKVNETDSAMIPRSYCCVGMKMEFVTDEEKIGFSYRMGYDTASYGQKIFDVFEDGVMTAAVRMDEKGGEFSYTRMKKESSKIEIYFPNCSQTIITGISSEKFVPTSKDGGKRKYLALGDSITQGAYAVHPSLYYGNALSRFLDAEFFSFGIGSEVFRPDVIDPDHPFVPDIITVAYGINDSVRPLTDEQIEENSAEFFSRLKKAYPKAAINAVSPIWINRYDPREAGYDGEAYVVRFDRIARSIKKAADLVGANFINGLEICPHCPEFYMDKAVHPNDTGFLLYTLGLIKNLKY